MGRLLLRYENASEATAAPVDYVKVIIDYSGDAPAIYLIDDQGNQTVVGGGGAGGPPLVGTPWGENAFDAGDVGRILQIQPHGDIAYSAFWSDMRLPVFAREGGDVDEGSGYAGELPGTASALTFLPADESNPAPRIEWRELFSPSQQNAGVVANYYSDSADQVALAAWDDEAMELNSRLDAIHRATYAPFSRIHPAALGEALQKGDIVTSRLETGIIKYFKADNVAGHDAVGVVVDFDVGMGEGVVYKGHGVMTNLVITGPDAVAGDHLYVSDTVPGAVMVGPPATGKKQYVGRARENSAEGLMYSLDMNIQPQQAI